MIKRKRPAGRKRVEIVRLRGLRNTVMRIGTALWKGRTITDHQREMEPVHTIKSGKNPKALIARHRYGENEHAALCYYPPAMEARQFVAGLLYVKEEGITERYPGSVGVTTIYKTSDSVGVSIMQGSFIQRETPELSKALIKKHQHWREHTLRYLFEHELDGRTRVSIHLSPKGGIKNKEIFIAIGKEFGFRVLSDKWPQIVLEKD
jgi:hypothetical protein